MKYSHVALPSRVLLLVVEFGKPGFGGDQQNFLNLQLLQYVRIIMLGWFQGFSRSVFFSSLRYVHSGIAQWWKTIDLCT
jgi:hypothetical protein